MLAPDLAKGIKRPEDLARLPLLIDEVTEAIRPRIGWTEWFAAAGQDAPDIHGARFNQADHAVSAAVAGTGAIMGRGSLTESALREGRLVMPFPLSIQRRRGSITSFVHMGSKPDPTCRRIYGLD